MGYDNCKLIDRAFLDQISIDLQYKPNQSYLLYHNGDILYLEFCQHIQQITSISLQLQHQSL